MCGRAFLADLNILASLPATAAMSTGFAMNTISTALDQAYGLAQCHTNVNASDYRACHDGSMQDMTRVCPCKKSTILIYNACQLHHFIESFFSAIDASMVVSLVNS
ncbi:cysteine-rich receptor-like protein kinase 6 [Miscanthus floridulus]|uniref:cysteine-rich receptor-like protein kinase 6 n=1 Tax=Miscanthus floridulus TaxID=154761 RepID=UPI00345915C3